VLITGASGLLGVAAIEKFLSAGWEVVGVSRRTRFYLTTSERAQAAIDAGKSAYRLATVRRRRLQPDVICFRIIPVLSLSVRRRTRLVCMWGLPREPVRARRAAAELGALPCPHCSEVPKAVAVAATSG